MFLAHLRRSAVVIPLLLIAPFMVVAWCLRKLGSDRIGLSMAARGQQLWARMTCAVLGIHLDTLGKPPVGAFVVTANHLSYIDVLVLGALFPGRFIAKSEIATWPLAGTIVRMSGTLFVRRGDRTDVPRMVARMKATLESGVGITYFPEGYASRGLTVKRFHAGLLQSAVAGGFPCLPVALSYSTPRSELSPAWTVGWWGSVSLGPHMLRMLAQGPIVARVRWAAQPLVGDERKQLAADLHAQVLEHFEPLGQESLPEPLPGDPLATDELED
jgi:1-acyl-sn-glycerol-3-phosphate acyltransferase